MPVNKAKLGGRMNGRYVVRDTKTGRILGLHPTKAGASAQVRSLNVSKANRARKPGNPHPKRRKRRKRAGRKVLGFRTIL